MGRSAVLESRKTKVAPIAFPVAVVVLDTRGQSDRLIGFQNISDKIGIEWHCCADAGVAAKGLNGISWHAGRDNKFGGIGILREGIVAESIKPSVRLLHSIWSEEYAFSGDSVKRGGSSVVDPVNIEVHSIVYRDVESVRVKNAAIPNIGALVGLKSFSGVVDKFSSHARLPESQSGVDNNGEKRSDLKQNFPPWRFVMAALAGIIGTTVGWWNLRREQREFVSTIVFLLGLSLWGYAVMGLLWWWGTKL
jgi:hypothetical protein